MLIIIGYKKENPRRFVHATDIMIEEQALRNKELVLILADISIIIYQCKIELLLYFILSLL